MQEVNERDILLACCGEDEDGNTKAVVNIKMSDINLINETEMTIDEVILDNPIINIYRSGLTTTVDLTFLTPGDYELMNLYGRLNEYTKMENEVSAENTIRDIFLTISPKEEYEEYYACGMHGSYFLQPSKVGGETDTIRFIFENEFFVTFKIESEEQICQKKKR